MSSGKAAHFPRFVLGQSIGLLYHRWFGGPCQNGRNWFLFNDGVFEWWCFAQ